MKLSQLSDLQQRLSKNQTHALTVSTVVESDTAPPWDIRASAQLPELPSSPTPVITEAHIIVPTSVVQHTTAITFNVNLIGTIVDMVEAHQQAFGAVFQMLKPNNHTKAGDEPNARIHLMSALARLRTALVPVHQMQHFLRQNGKPVLQSLADCLARACAIAQETLAGTSLLLDSAAIMQSCARRLATGQCTDATRGFLLNVQTQFDECCAAQSLTQLRALVEIHGLLRYGTEEAGFQSARERSAVIRVQAVWRGLQARRAVEQTK